MYRILSNLPPAFACSLPPCPLLSPLGRQLKDPMETVGIVYSPQNVSCSIGFSLWLVFIFTFLLKDKYCHGLKFDVVSCVHALPESHHYCSCNNGLPQLHLQSSFVPLLSSLLHLPLRGQWQCLNSL